MYDDTCSHVLMTKISFLLSSLENINFICCTLHETYFFSVLLGNDWYISLYKRKAYNMMVWFTYVMTTTIGSANIYFLMQVQLKGKKRKRGKNNFLVRIFKICFLNFFVYHTASSISYSNYVVHFIPSTCLSNK